MDGSVSYVLKVPSEAPPGAVVSESLPHTGKRGVALPQASLRNP